MNKGTFCFHNSILKRRFFALILTYVFFLFLCILSPILLYSDSILALEEGDNPWQLEMDVSQEAYMVVDMDKHHTLYSKNADQSRPGPLAVNLMLSILVCENIENKTPITASAEIARLSESEQNFQTTLKAGQRYESNYLMYLMLYYDSKAAAQLLGESVADSQEKLINMMNNRGRSLGLDDTRFYLSPNDKVQSRTQLSDVMLILLHANTFKRFSDIYLSDKNTYLPTYVDMGNTPFLENQMSAAWNWSQNAINGSSLAFQGNFFTAAYHVLGEEYNIMVLQASYQSITIDKKTLRTDIIREAFDVMERVFAFFEKVTLVKKGELCRKIVQQDGVTIDLIYLDNVDYLRPVGATDYSPSAKLSVSNTIPLPIEAGEVLGQMIFTMPDQTRYIAGVGSKTAIFSENKNIGHLMTQIQNNPQIILLIVVFSGIFLAIALLKLINHFIVRAMIKNGGTKRK